MTCNVFGVSFASLNLVRVADVPGARFSKHPKMISERI